MLPHAGPPAGAASRATPAARRRMRRRACVQPGQGGREREPAACAVRPGVGDDDEARRSRGSTLSGLAAARRARPPELPTSWDGLPEGVLAAIFATLPRRSLQAARLVCRWWRAVADGSVSALAPGDPRIHTITARFPALRCLNLSLTARNRAVMLLSRPDALRGLRALALGSGSDGGGPERWRPHPTSSRLTNSAVAFLAAGCARTRLTALKLSGCDALTNAGVAALTALTGLRCLVLVGCGRVTDAGLARLVGGLPSLSALQTTVGADATLGALARRGDGCTRATPLTALCLGGKGAERLTGEGLAGLAPAAAASLRSLCLTGAHVSATALAPFTRLTWLALRDCHALDGRDGFAPLAATLKGLASLDVRGSADGYAAAAAFAGRPPGAAPLRSLRLEGAPASPAAARALVDLLPGLSDLGVEAYSPAEGGRGVLTAACLQLAAAAESGRRTALTRLSVHGASLPAPLLAALAPAFPALAELQVRDWGGDLDACPLTGRPLPPKPTPSPPRPCVVGPLAGLTALTALCLASPRATDADVLALADGAFPRLESLVLADAPGVSAGSVAALKAARPGLDVGRVRRRAPDEWTDVGAGRVWE